jgi:hypothetical protein
MVDRTKLTHGKDIPRISMLVLGAWLFISAFLWPHTEAQRTNAWVVGALVVAASLVSARLPQARYANTVLSVWLFLSVWVLPTMMPGTVWNNLLVAVALFVASMVRTEVPGGRFERRAPV